MLEYYSSSFSKSVASREEQYCGWATSLLEPHSGHVPWRILGTKCKVSRTLIMGSQVIFIEHSSVRCGRGKPRSAATEGRCCESDNLICRVARRSSSDRLGVDLQWPSSLHSASETDGVSCVYSVPGGRGPVGQQA